MEDAADEGVELRNRLDAAITDAAMRFYSLDDDYMSIELTSPEKRLCGCGTVRETNGWSAVDCGLERGFWLAKG